MTAAARVARRAGPGLALALFLAMAGPGAALPSARLAPVVDGPAELSAFRRNPSHVVDTPVKCAVTLRAVGAAFDPLLTRFDPAHWVRFEAWSDDQFLWVERDYRASAPCLFVRRGSEAEARLLAARPYDRLEIEGRVLAISAGEPWIEVERLSPAPVSLTEATVFHAARAIRLANQGHLELAKGQMELALAAPMPDHMRTELQRVGANLGTKHAAGRER